MEDNLKNTNLEKQKKIKRIKLLKVENPFFQNAKALSPKKSLKGYSIKSPFFSSKLIGRKSIQSSHINYPNKTEEIKLFSQKISNSRSPKKINSFKRLLSMKFRESSILKKHSKKNNEKRKSEMFLNKYINYIRPISPKKVINKKSTSCKMVDNFASEISNSKNNTINIKKVSKKDNINNKNNINIKNKIKNKNIINNEENKISKNSIIKIKNKNDKIEEKKNDSDKKVNKFKKFFCCL